MPNDRNEDQINSGLRGLLSNPLLYDTTQTIFGAYKHKENHFNKFFSELRGKQILDIGCGTGFLLNYLHNSNKYVGCDMEQKYIDSIRVNYDQPNVELYCEKVGEVERKEWINRFDFINAHGLIHHLSDKDTQYLLDISFTYLKPGGQLITVDSLYHKNQSKFSRWMVSKDRGQNVRQTAHYLDLANAVFEKVEYSIDDHALRIPFSLLTMILTK